VDLLVSNLEKLAPPQVIEQRDWVKSRWAEIERGFKAARHRLRQRGGLPAYFTTKPEAQPVQPVVPKLKEPNAA
jgi:hypothetical protein